MSLVLRCGVLGGETVAGSQSARAGGYVIVKCDCKVKLSTAPFSFLLLRLQTYIWKKYVTNVWIKIFHHSLDHGASWVNFNRCVLKIKVSWLQKDYGGISDKKTRCNLGYIIYLSLLNNVHSIFFCLLAQVQPKLLIRLVGTVVDLAFYHRVCHRNFFLYNLVKPFDKQLWKFTTEFGIKALNNVKISLKFNN